MTLIACFKAPDFRKKLIKALLILIAILLICVTPMLSSLYSYNRTHVNVEREEIQYASVKNTEITQTIYLDGHMSNLGIAFYAPSGQLYGDSTVSIMISQGDRYVVENVPAAKLRVLSPYSVDSETNRSELSKYEMTYFLKSNLWQFSGGEATVKVVSYDLPVGTDLFCEVSSTAVSGLPSAMAGGVNVLGSPMVLEYDLFRTDVHFWYETILLAVLVLLSLFTAWIIAFKPLWIERCNLLFICAVAIIFVVISIRNPYAAFWGEPRSEAAYEFWKKAHDMGLFGSMMSLMSGEALAWWERLLMWIADAISPRQYVFVVAQLMELVWISLVTAMPCVRSFKRFFGDEIRLVISLFLGTALMFDSAYYFWGCSYWAILFILMFALLPMEKMKPVTYWAGIILSIILCVSRIYFVLLIPLAVIAAFTLSKCRGKRFNLYCWVVALSSLFEGVYSLSVGSSLASGTDSMKNILDIGIGRMIENTLYYQMQVINSFFSGSEHWQGSGTNVLSFLVFSLVLALFINLLFKKKFDLALWIGGLGYLSLGSIAINVYTSGSYAQVSFPHNYASKVNWGENIYQQADFHFSIAYFALFFIIITLVYLLRQKGIECIRTDNTCQAGEKAKFLISQISSAGIVFVLLIASACSVKERVSYYKLSVEWQSVYTATEKSPYFLAINTFYGAAPISLEDGTDEMIFGINESGELYEWHEGLPAYELDKVYHEANIGSVSDSAERPIISVTAYRSLTNFNVKYVAVLRDINGIELARAAQSQTDRRIWLDFQFDEPVLGVYSISFELDDGYPAFIQDGLQVGYVLPN